MSEVPQSVLFMEDMGEYIAPATFCDVCNDIVGVIPTLDSEKGGDKLVIAFHEGEEGRKCSGSYNEVDEFCLLTEEELLSLVPREFARAITKLGEKEML